MGVDMDRSISPTELLQGTFAASPRVGQPNSGTAETSAPGNMGCLKLGDTATAIRLVRSLSHGERPLLPGSGGAPF